MDWRRVVKVNEGVPMPQSASIPKRERQCEHIKESLEDRGTNEGKAEEMAARTVNKERAASRPLEDAQIRAGENPEPRARGRR
jgi:hypothetical protein